MKYIIFFLMVAAVAPVRAQAPKAAKKTPIKVVISHSDDKKKLTHVKASGAALIAVVEAIPKAHKEKDDKGFTTYTGANLVCGTLLDVFCSFEIDVEGHVEKPSGADKNVFTTLPIDREVSPLIAVTPVKDDALLKQLTIQTAKGGKALAIAKGMSEATIEAGPAKNQSTVKGMQIWCVVTRDDEDPKEQFKLTEEALTAMEGRVETLESVACSFVFDPGGKVFAPTAVPKL